MARVSGMDSADKMFEVMRIYLENPNGLTDIELSEMLEVERISAWRYRKALQCKENETDESRYRFIPRKQHIELAKLILAAVEIEKP